MLMLAGVFSIVILHVALLGPIHGMFLYYGLSNSNKPVDGPSQTNVPISGC